jgi:N-acetylglucosamine kinase-like BadF-type ATPase
VSTSSSTRPAVLAVDSGATKIDAVLLTAKGEVLGCARGPGASFSPSDHDRSMERLLTVLNATCERAGVALDGKRLAQVGVFCMAGDDLPSDDRRLRRALGHLELVSETVVRNDTFAVLRAGTERDWGVGIVCGTGLNCCGVGPSGRIVRYAALGLISGDEGGGGWLADMAIGSAVRARDGRGPRTALENAIPEHFGVRSPLAVVEGFHTGQLNGTQMREVPPIVFRCVDAGDPVAAGLVDTLADEVVGMGASAVRRLRLTRRDVEIVLGGGVVRGGNDRFLSRVREGLLAVAPHAEIKPFAGPPVAGAALLGLDRLRAGRAAKQTLRESLTHETLVSHASGRVERRQRGADRPR